MAKQTMKDQFANQGYIDILMSAANVLTFIELNTYVSIFEKKAFIINRAEYSIAQGSLAELDTESDYIQFGIATQNNWTGPGLGQAAVVDFNWVLPMLHGTAANLEMWINPIIKDFSALPGGGIIVPSRPIYGWATSSGFAAAANVACRLYFTVLDLVADQYWELVEATRLVS